MPNILEIGESQLNKLLGQFAGEEVVYCPRGIGQSKTVLAVVGKSFFRVSDVNGFSTYARTVDFIIQASELEAEPHSGDVILRNGQKFEVFRPNNETCWRWSGSNHETYRIHTHAVGDEFE